ncbi:MAG: serine protease [Chloroflexota bacterium]
MPSDSVQKGIAAIQGGKPKEGKRLIRYGLKNDPMTKHERVSALIWLAETDTNPQFKVEQYQQAIQLDPTNQDVIRRLNYWMNEVQQAPQQPAPQQNPPLPNQPPQQQSDSQQWNAGQFNQQNQQQQQWNQQAGDSQQWNARQFNQQNPQGQQSDSQQWNAGQFNQRIQSDSQQWNPNNLNNRPNTGTDQFNTLIQGDSQRWDTQNVNQRGSTGQFDPHSLNNPNDSQQWNPQQQQPNQQQNWQQWNQQQINNLHDTGTFPAQNAQQNWQAGGTSRQMPVQNQTIQIQQVQRTVGITGGAGGIGTGFFVTLDGIVATTRHIVGGAREVTVQLLDGRSTRGQVVRAFPAFDLVLIQTNVQLIRLMNVLQQPSIPDNATMVAVTHSGQGLRTAKRRSANNIGGHWFPTLINKLMDEGGNPMFNERNVLVGMLTKNASRASGYMYGLHIHKIYECVDQYVYEKGQVADRQTIYCNSCGIISVAPSYRGFFCEHCGIKHPYVEENMLEPQPTLAGLYGENDRPCQNCGSQIGIYNGACMRCGAEIV